MRSFLLCRKEENMGGGLGLGGGKSVKALQAEASSLRTRIARLEKRGNIAERMWRKLEWEAMPTRDRPYKPREADKAREQLFRTGGYRKRAYNLKMQLELVEREISEKKAGKPKQARKSFVNGFGEATKRYVTSGTYERAQKRQDKEIFARLSHYR